MHSPAAVAAVLELREQGLGARRIASRTGLPLATVSDWLAGRVPKHSRRSCATSIASCHRCGQAAHQFERLPVRYVYLLGLYLSGGPMARAASPGSDPIRRLPVHKHRKQQLERSPLWLLAEIR
jgi:hypothetical protein